MCKIGDNCPLSVLVYIPTAETTKQCFVSQLATQERDEHGFCGLTFYNHDIDKVKRMTVVSKYGDRSNHQLISQAYQIILKTDILATHEMASYYLLERVKV